MLMIDFITRGAAMKRFDLHGVDFTHELDGFEFPATFDFGVSSSGYQSEGGYNTPDGPKNNWHWAEWRGEKERTGDAARFWELYGEDFDRARWIGANAFRLGIEWARLQPSVDPAQTVAPPFSEEAARDYAKIMAACFEREMFPAVTLYHWTHPLWAGLELWLDWPRASELFGAYVAFAVERINHYLVEEFNRPPIPYFITMNEPINVPMAGYLLGVFPREKKGRRNAAICYANILKAHALCYRTVHRIYREHGWAAPTVTMNSWCGAAYSFDKFSQDVMLARQNGIARDAVFAHLHQQQRRFAEHTREVPYHRGPRGFKRLLDRFIDQVMWRKLSEPLVAELVEYLYAGDASRLLDAVSFDLYDPFMGNNFDFTWPSLVTVRSRPDQWNINPGALRPMLSSYRWTAGDLPIDLLEHGMCHRAHGGRVEPHPNGVTRDLELKLIMLEVVRALREGQPLRSFYYWSLTDNYEWGSYEPRFGLFGVDYENGARRLSTDINGVNAAGCYRLFIEAFRAKDTQALREAFTAETYPEYAGA